MDPDHDVQGLYAALLDPANYSLDLTALPNLIAALLIGPIGVLVVRLERGSRASQFFASVCLLVLLWSAGRAVALWLTDADLALFLARRVNFPLFLTLPMLYHFLAIMLRMERQRMNWIRVHWAIAAFLVLASITTTSVVEGVRQFWWGYEPHFGPLGVAAVAWLAWLLVAVAYDAAGAWRRAPQGSRERRRIGWYSLALAVLYLASVEFLPGLGVEVFPFGAVPATAFILITAYLTFRYGLVEVTPTLAAREIADLAPGGLLMIDAEGLIQYANERCDQIFGRNPSELLRLRSRELGDALDPELLADLARSQGADAEREWIFMHPRLGQARDLALSAFAVKGPRGNNVAYVCHVRDVTEQRRAEQERRRAALRDPLTGLANRELFLSVMDGVFDRASPDSPPLGGLLYLGLHRLRLVNEDLGFAVGDRALAEVSRRLRQQLRPTDTAARVGGDEFAVLRRGTATPAELLAAAAALREVLRAPMDLDGHEVHIGASVGVALLPGSHSLSADALRDAAFAMHGARDAAGGVALAGEAGVSGQRMRREAELRAALREGQLRVHYQPVVDLERREAVGLEALVRWDHPQHGLLLPDLFIPLAEDLGLVDELDAFVLERACADLAALQRLPGGRGLGVSVNLGEAFLRRSTAADQILAAKRRHRIAPGNLRIELLEQITHVEPVIEVLRRVRDAGLGLYLDDFGIGYSALSRLHQLPLTGLKIDRTFVHAMSKGGEGDPVISAIVSLARGLGLRAIAEGVSTAAEVRRLQALGCHWIQGHYFAEAMGFEDLVRWLADIDHLLRCFAVLDSRPLPSAALPSGPV